MWGLHKSAEFNRSFVRAELRQVSSKISQHHIASILCTRNIPIYRLYCSVLSANVGLPTCWRYVYTALAPTLISVYIMWLRNLSIHCNDKAFRLDYTFLHLGDWIISISTTVSICIRNSESVLINVNDWMDEYLLLNSVITWLDRFSYKLNLQIALN